MEPWRELPWYRDAIAIVALRQTKWWYMKRFLHPDIVAPYDYIFLWDEDIGTEGFSPDKLLQVAREEKLQIFQPAVDAGPVSWPITRKVDGLKLHRRAAGWGSGGISNGTGDRCAWESSVARGTREETKGKRSEEDAGRLTGFFDPALSATHPFSPLSLAPRIGAHRRTSRDTRCRKDREGRGADQQPPCGNHIEIMVPVLSRAAWACVWNILPADLIHGWGLDLAWRVAPRLPMTNI